MEHRTVFEGTDAAVKLPFTEAILKYHPNGCFPLLMDPKVERKAVIIGMFVLRPAQNKALTGDIIDSDGLPTKDIYDPELNWVYNLDGIDGGWVIANLNSVDAYRLGMQYGVSDAVMVGTSTACAEGISKKGKLGYLWQPYYPLNWDSVKHHDSSMVEKVAEMRKLWQDLGYLSDRKYPAQILITRSGKKPEDYPDFLEARIFTATHPTGEPVESYILTTKVGAERIRDRCHLFDLQDRIDDILIVLPSFPSGEEDMDLSSLPSLLYEKYNMKIVDHDGGQKVLQDFCRQGVIPQMNLTLGRKMHLQEVLQRLPTSIISEELSQTCLSSFDKRVRSFFSYPLSSQPEDKATFSQGIPPSLPISYCVEDDNKDVAVITFNTKGGFDFYQTISS
jgi:hypothetical protein